MMPNLMAAPEGETERRREIARHLVEWLARETDLRASLLAGSAAQGTSDQHSDIDLLNYYEVLPQPAAFDAVLIATAHEAVDYQQLADWAPLIVDTRNVMSGFKSVDGRIWKA